MTATNLYRAATSVLILATLVSATTTAHALGPDPFRTPRIFIAPQPNLNPSPFKFPDLTLRIPEPSISLCREVYEKDRETGEIRYRKICDN